MLPGGLIVALPLHHWYPPTTGSNSFSVGRTTVGCSGFYSLFKHRVHRLSNLRRLKNDLVKVLRDRTRNKYTLRFSVQTSQTNQDAILFYYSSGFAVEDFLLQHKISWRMPTKKSDGVVHHLQQQVPAHDQATHWSEHFLYWLVSDFMAS